MEVVGSDFSLTENQTYMFLEFEVVVNRAGAGRQV